MERYPAGIGKKGFMQKDVSKGFPEWLERVEVPKKDGTVHHPLVTDTRSLLWIANQNSITPHVWTSRVPDLYHPDICVFDLDPSRRRSRRAARGGARAARSARRARAAELGEDVRLEGLSHRRSARRQGATWARSSGFAHHVGCDAGEAAPDHLTQEFSKVDRGGGFSSTRDATAGARRLRPRPTPCAPSRARRCRRRARGRKSSAARSGRGRSRCGRWRSGSPRSATCGRTCASGGGRCGAQWSAAAVPGEVSAEANREPGRDRIDRITRRSERREVSPSCSRRRIEPPAPSGMAASAAPSASAALAT